MWRTQRRKGRERYGREMKMKGGGGDGGGGGRSGGRGCQVVKMFILGLEEERSFSRHASAAM
jgi:hypothetical protein